MRRIRTYILSTLIVFLWVSFSSDSALAASLYLDPAYQVLHRGDSVMVSVRLNTDGEREECINVVDAVLHYSGNIEPVDVSVGDSIFSLWVEKPTINRQEKTVTFAGGTPNGYCGRVAGDPRLSNTLARIVFRSPGFSVGTAVGDATKATIDFSQETKAYLNDGSGSEALLRTLGTSLVLSDKPSSSGTLNPWKEEVSADKEAPEKFSITLLKSDLIFSGRHYIVFNTVDKQTGIDAYYVMEEPISELKSFQWGRADAPWIEARSPYVLKDQSLNSVIRVKAVDKAGNEYIATLVPDESQRQTPFLQLILVLFGSISFGLFAWLLVAVYRRWMVRKEKQLQTEESRITTNSFEERSAEETTVHDNDNEYERDR